MKTKLFFGENINGTNKTGIVKLVDNRPFLVCNCSKEDYILIKESFYPSSEIERLKEENEYIKKFLLEIKASVQNSFVKEAIDGLFVKYPVALSLSPSNEQEKKTIDEIERSYCQFCGKESCIAEQCIDD